MQEIADILKISKSIKLLVKVKNVSFILQKKPHGFFGQDNIYSHYVDKKNGSTKCSIYHKCSNLLNGLFYLRKIHSVNYSVGHGCEACGGCTLRRLALWQEGGPSCCGTPTATRFQWAALWSHRSRRPGLK